MVDSESTTKEVIEAQLTASGLERLAGGYGNVEIEGESTILRLHTDNIGLSGRMSAIEDAYHNTYSQARRELE